MLDIIRLGIMTKYIFIKKIYWLGILIICFNVREKR